MSNVQGLVQRARHQQRRMAISLAAVAVLAAACFGPYQIFAPAERGVLPLGPSNVVQGEFLVKFKPGTPAEERSNAHAGSRAETLEEIAAIGVTHMRVPPGSSVGEMVALYSRNPNIEYAEPNFLRQAIDTPNDPYFGNQWNLAKAMMAPAWDIQMGSAAVTIAVLDSVIDVLHEDIAGRFTGAPPTITATGPRWPGWRGRPPATPRGLPGCAGSA
ncbi:MAG: hypothetical protein AAB289_12635 [Chloroflexota bacterium]